MKLIRTLFCAMTIFLLASCGKESGDVPEPQRRIPESYLNLVVGYRDGKRYVDVKVLSRSSKIFFEDGNSLIIPADDFVIEDCRSGKAPREVTADAATGEWTVGGEATGIFKTSGKMEESFPLYSCFDEEKLSVFVSNGDTLKLVNANYHEPDPPVGKEYVIPKIHIATDGHAPVVSKEDYVKGTIRIEDPGKWFSDVDVLEATMRIRGRGNSTWGMPKKPYRIKLDSKESILGISKEKDWVLLANYSDKTLLRNITAMRISRILGMKWTPEMISAEVWLNDEYQGVYTFTEHKKVSKNRVNIEVVKETDNSGEAVTGGYYLEIEEAMDEPVCFKTGKNVPVMFHDPENPTAEQQAYVKEWFSLFERALDDIGKDGGLKYDDYIDVASFVNYYIIQELTLNPDGNVRKSTFVTKERNSKLEMYHVWDFDITLGNCNYFQDDAGRRMWLIRGCVWYNQLFRDPVFVAKVKSRWNEVYPELKTIPDFVQEERKLLGGAEDRNFERWRILGQYVWPNYAWFQTYDEEIKFLLNFYNDRLEWFNDEINK